MDNKKRKARSGTFPYLVTGPSPKFINGIFEWTSAISENQAIRQVAKKLEQKYPHMRIYLGDCTATRYEKKSTEDEQKPKQGVLL